MTNLCDSTQWYEKWCVPTGRDFPSLVPHGFSRVVIACGCSLVIPLAQSLFMKTNVKKAVKTAKLAKR